MTEKEFFEQVRMKGLRGDLMPYPLPEGARGLNQVDCYFYHTINSSSPGGITLVKYVRNFNHNYHLDFTNREYGIQFTLDRGHLASMTFSPGNAVLENAPILLGRKKVVKEFKALSRHELVTIASLVVCANTNQIIVGDMFKVGGNFFKRVVTSSKRKLSTTINYGCFRPEGITVLVSEPDINPENN